jgi:protein tyrosine/serine phosphatase
VTAFDVTTKRGRLATYLHYTFFDHAYFRLVWRNAHWLSDELARANQPWPFQIKAWGQRGVKTIINLRGGADSHHALEIDACRRHGIKYVSFALGSRDVPRGEKILAAKALFEAIEYPAMMHCKSGADRAGLMSVLYMHFRRGLPIREAVRQLSLKFGHFRSSETGVLDYVFERYMEEAEPTGLSFTQWVESPAYDAPAIARSFKAQWWGTLLADRILRRE